MLYDIRGSLFAFDKKHFYSNQTGNASVGQTSWVKKWKKNGWKTSAGEEATNRKELEELDAVEKNISVKYVN